MTAGRDVRDKFQVWWTFQCRGFVHDFQSAIQRLASWERMKSVKSRLFNWDTSKRGKKNSKEFCKTVTMLNGCWISWISLFRTSTSTWIKNMFFISMLKKLKGRMYHTPLLNEGTSTWRLDIFLKKSLCDKGVLQWEANAYFSWICAKLMGWKGGIVRRALFEWV